MSIAVEEEQEVREQKNVRVNITYLDPRLSGVVDNSRVIGYEIIDIPILKTDITDTFEGQYWSCGKSIKGPLPSTLPQYCAKYIADTNFVKNYPENVFKEAVYQNPIAEKISDASKIKVNTVPSEEDFSAAKTLYGIPEAEEKNKLNEAYSSVFGRSNDDVIARYNELLGKSPQASIEDLFKEAVGGVKDYTKNSEETAPSTEIIKFNQYSNDSDKNVNCKNNTYETNEKRENMVRRLVSVLKDIGEIKRNTEGKKYDKSFDKSLDDFSRLFYETQRRHPDSNVLPSPSYQGKIVKLDLNDVAKSMKQELPLPAENNPFTIQIQRLDRAADYERAAYDNIAKSMKQELPLPAENNPFTIQIRTLGEWNKDQ